MTAVGRARPILGALPRPQPLLTHQSSDPRTTDATAEDVRQTRAAVRLAATLQTPRGCAAAARRFSRSRGPGASPTQPVVIAAARDQQSFAEPTHFVLAAHVFDLGILLGGGSERMPREFFLGLHAAPRASRSPSVNRSDLDCSAPRCAPVVRAARRSLAHRYNNGGRIPSSAATLAALRPLFLQCSNACCLYSAVYLAFPLDGF